MKYTVTAVFTNTGIAKATQQPYSMTRAIILQPFVDTDTTNFQSHGDGLIPVELSVNSSFATQLQNTFNQAFKAKGMPLQMDLVTSLDRDGRNVITGFEKPVDKVA